MDKIAAMSKAQEILRQLLENQPALFNEHALSTPDRARSAAKSIAAFRAELISELEKQEN